MTNVRDFAAFKAERRKISIVTAYDAWSAHLVERSQVDAILIGDSALFTYNFFQSSRAGRCQSVVAML
jgi:ketopantoate hydroxymethyltransferase